MELCYGLEKIANLHTKTEKNKAEILAKKDKDKRELILWMVGLILGFLTLNITAIWEFSPLH
ncbi:MAG: hypothetical protein ACE5KZ_10560 [Candidatus Scalinduaceae bacterium]